MTLPKHEDVAMTKPIDLEPALEAATGEDHTVEFFDYDDECWNCGGEGYVYNCVDEIGCVDPEGGCDYCMRRCDICNSKRKVQP